MHANLCLNATLTICVMFNALLTQSAHAEKTNWGLFLPSFNGNAQISKQYTNIKIDD